MRFMQTIVFLVFLLLIGAFAVQNTEVISVHFLSWKLSQPLALFAVVLYILGMLSGWTVVAFVRGSFRRATQRPEN